MLKNILVWLLGVLITGLCSAQQPLVHHITETEGLPSILVYDLFVDSKGKLWLGTEEGIYWYDGFEFHGYALSNARSTAVSGICQTPSGEILFRNFSSQVFVLSQDSVSMLSLLTPKGIKRDFKDFTQASTGVFYFLKDSVLYRAKNPINDSAQVAWGQKVNGASLRWLNSIVNDTLFYSENHLIELKSQKVIPNPYKTRATGYYAEQILQYDYVNSSHFYLGENDSMFIFEDGRKTTINRIYHETDNSVWLCTRDGLSHIENGKYTTWFSGQVITDIVSDKDGNYWVSTLNYGIYRIPKQGAYWFTGNQNELLGKHITLVQWKDDFTLLVGTNEGKLYRANLLGQVDLVFDTQFKEAIKQVMVTKFGWVVTGHSFYFLNHDFSLIQKGINAAKELAQINDSLFVYASGEEGGLYNMNKRNRSAHRVRRSRAALEHNGVCFIGYDDSLMMSQDFTDWQSIKGKKGGLITSELMVQEDTIWIATYHQGVLKYNSNGLQEEIGTDLIDRVLHMKHANGQLYLATISGLYSWNYETKKLVNLTYKLGLPKGAIPYFDLSDSMLSVASRKGLIIYNLKSIEYFKETPNPTRITLQVPLQKSYPHTTDEILIDFDYWDYRGSDMRLYYRIDEGEWKERSLFPSRLTISAPPPGQHKLEFAVGKDLDVLTIWHTEDIQITPPYHATWWFRLFLVLIPLLLLGAYYTRRIRRHREKSLQELRINQAELDKGLSQLTALRSQMNPHFLFNALNSIQDFILQNDKGEANRYLGKFADLIRSTLNLSSMELIPIRDELKALQNYLELEALRFHQDLSWHISVDESIDSSYYKIPPLFIQPFVENAIKHGLLHIEGGKRLTIKLYLSKDLLHIEIEDNGIGIEASTSKKLKDEEHRSFAMGASLSRVELLNNVYGGKINLEIISPVKDGKGTLIKIQIPNLSV